MPALVAGIHVFSACPIEDVDGRNKSGHDDGESHVTTAGLIPHAGHMRLLLLQRHHPPLLDREREPAVLERERLLAEQIAPPAM